MQNEEIRMVRKRFKCDTCNRKMSVLVLSNQNVALCKHKSYLGDQCDNVVHEISENEYTAKSREEINQNYRMVFDKNENKPQTEQKQRSNNESKKNNFVPPRENRQSRNLANNNNNDSRGNVFNNLFGTNNVFGNMDEQYRNRSNDHRRSR
jgi:hypothetical protein